MPPIELDAEARNERAEDGRVFEEIYELATMPHSGYREPAHDTEVIKRLKVAVGDVLVTARQLHQHGGREEAIPREGTDYRKVALRQGRRSNRFRSPPRFW